MATPFAETIFNLKKEREFVYKVLESLDNAISILEQGFGAKGELPIPSLPQPENSPKINDKLAGYDQKWTIIDKIRFIINKKGIFLQTRDVAKILIIHGGIKGITDEKKVIEKISAPISLLGKKGELYKYAEEGRGIITNTFWGLPEWVENGKIKAGHEFNPNV